MVGAMVIAGLSVFTAATGTGLIFRRSRIPDFDSCRYRSRHFSFLTVVLVSRLASGRPVNRGKRNFPAAKILFLSIPVPCRTGKNTADVSLISRVSGGVTGTRSPVFFSFASTHGSHSVSFLPPQATVYFFSTGVALLCFFAIRPSGRRLTAGHVAAPVGKFARRTHTGFFHIGKPGFPFRFL